MNIKTNSLSMPRLNPDVLRHIAYYTQHDARSSLDYSEKGLGPFLVVLNRTVPDTETSLRLAAPIANKVMRTLRNLKLPTCLTFQMTLRSGRRLRQIDQPNPASLFNTQEALERLKYLNDPELDLEEKGAHFYNLIEQELLKHGFTGITHQAVSSLKPKEFDRLNDIKEDINLLKVAQILNPQRSGLSQNNLEKIKALFDDNNKVHLTKLARVFELADSTRATLIANRANFQAVQSLRLSSRNLTYIPAEISQLFPQLTDLYLSNNSIVIIPDSLAKLSLLRVLDLTLNNISTIPDSLATLSQLERLDLSLNKISTIPDSLAMLSQLCDLDLSHNNISTIPDSLATLPQLETIDLAGNNISTIPDSLPTLSQLKTLALSHNNISTIPNSLATLPQLRTIDLSHNNISTIPDFLPTLSQLKTLALSHNNISTIPNSLATLPQLNYLFLSHNNILTVPTSLNNLTELKHLTLSNGMDVSNLSPALLEKVYFKA